MEFHPREPCGDEYQEQRNFYGGEYVADAGPGSYADVVEGGEDGDEGG
jgi:hypothetical protein